MSWNVDPDRAWLGVLSLVAILGVKRLIDTALPRGARFKFMSRWLDYESKDELAERRKRDDPPPPADPDDPDIDKWMGAGG